VKAYLDNNVVCAIAKDDTPAESDALDRLLVAYEEAKVGLVTSELTLEEIKAYRGQRRSVERTFRLLEKVPIVRWDQLLGINSHGDKYTWINSPMIQNDLIYGKLLELGVETVDAQHVFVAAKNACDAFLTCDKGILQRSPAIGKLCSLVVQTPSGFVASKDGSARRSPVA
jgi:predicted nucleic acid-binding protein